MSRFSKAFIVLAVLILVVGCGRKPASLHGIWKVDVDKCWAAMKEKPEFASIPEAGRKKLEDGFRTTMAATVFNFSDGKLAFTMGPVSEDGEFKVVTSKGDAWDVEVKGAKMDKPKAAKLTWIDDDHITLDWTASGAPVAFSLIRQK